MYYPMIEATAIFVTYTQWVGEYGLWHGDIDI